MNRLLGVIFGAAALTTGAAMAADLTPVLKAPPSIQQQPVSGYVGLYAGGDWAHYGFPDANVPGENETSSTFLFGGEGRANWWMDRNWALQLDVEGEGTGGVFRSCSFSDCTREARYAGTVGGHAAYRIPGSFAIAAFGGLSASNLLDFDGGMTYGFGGLEAQSYWSMVTLYGQGGFFGRAAGIADDQIKNGWFLRGVVRLFPTPNDKVSGEVEYASGTREVCTACPGATQDVLVWGATYEHRFMGKPLSMFASYEGMRYRDNDSTFVHLAKVDESKVMGGIKLYMNEDTLLYNDHNGATWDMPKFLKTLSWGDVAAEGGRNSLPVSDIRLKRDIARIAELDNGLGLYRYRYEWSDTVYVGVMAQEVAYTVPEAAVVGADGYLRVDYARLGLRLMTLAEWSALSYGTGLGGLVTN
jgi:Chaperone of endosialidase